MEEAFTYIATRTNPVLVAITDKSGETLEYVLDPDIQVQVSTLDGDEDGSSADTSGG